MTASRLIAFLLGLGIFYLINLLIHPVAFVQLSKWQFHILHAAIALAVGVVIEVLYRRHLELHLGWWIINNPAIRQFGINMAIWLVLALIVWYDLKTPGSRMQLLLYSFVTYLAMSALITTSNLITKEKIK
jgi:hypothetical protein